MKLVIVFMTCFLVAGCGCSSNVASLKSYGKEHKISMYNGGVLIASWGSVGKVTSMVNSDGWQFMDKKTGKLVRVGGDVIIEVI